MILQGTSVFPAGVPFFVAFGVHDSKRDGIAANGTMEERSLCHMDTRVALIGIIIENMDSVGLLNEILHEYRQ